MISCVSAHAALAQLVERLTRNEKVTSPILVSGSPSRFHGLPPKKVDHVSYRSVKETCPTREWRNW